MRLRWLPTTAVAALAAEIADGPASGHEDWTVSVSGMRLEGQISFSLCNALQAMGFPITLPAPRIGPIDRRLWLSGNRRTGGRTAAQQVRSRTACPHDAGTQCRGIYNQCRPERFGRKWRPSKSWSWAAT